MPRTAIKTVAIVEPTPTLEEVQHRAHEARATTKAELEAHRTESKVYKNHVIDAALEGKEVASESHDAGRGVVLESKIESLTALIDAATDAMQIDGDLRKAKAVLDGYRESETEARAELNAILAIPNPDGLRSREGDDRRRKRLHDLERQIASARVKYPQTEAKVRHLSGRLAEIVAPHPALREAVAHG